jgi:hypothetical protein
MQNRTNINYPRSEASSFSWTQLNRSQKHAFKDIVAKLAEATRGVDANSSRVDDIHTPGLSRHSRTLMFSSERGMDRTSLMLALHRAFADSKAWIKSIESANGATESNLELAVDDYNPGPMEFIIEPSIIPAISQSK